jgi:GrpB-like predicted nucleotidyltransferase (UPF0157 family)
MLIQKYKESWIEDFTAIQKVINEALVNLKVLVEHVGSTSIPQLAAKPIIDIDVVFAAPAAFDEIKMRLEKIGYFHNGNQGIPGREVFKRGKNAAAHWVLDVIIHHLYVCPADSEEVQKHILFRDYLIANEDARLQYQNLKYEIAAAANQHPKKYAQLKEVKAGIFINTIIEKTKPNNKLHTMLKQIIFTVALAGFICCTPNKQQPQNTIVTDSAAVVNDPKNNLNIQTSSFTEVDSSGILMFPLSMAETERNGGSLLYKDMPASSYWNIIFLNTATGQHHLLSENKMLIRNYNANYSGKNEVAIAQTKQYIFYTTVTNDYNKDKLFSHEDPAYLFVSDKAGNNFRQISPSNYNLQNWQFIKATGKIILTLKKDSDKNSKFDDTDEVTSFEVDMEKDAQPREVFADSFKNKLKILYDRDWKRVKK